MSSGDNRIGAIEWRDLTVDDAESVADFYQAVVGWQSSPVSMGDYNDFNMVLPDSDETAAGVCHARGSNADMPAQWLMYVRVADVAQSCSECERLGGKVLNGPRSMSGLEFAVIEDPAGAVLAIMSGD